MARKPTGFIVPVVYSEYYGRSPTIGDLRATVARMHWQGVVKLSAGIASISWMRGVETDSLQLELVTRLAGRLIHGPAIIARLRGDTTSRLITRESLLALLRTAVVERSTGDVSDSEYPDYFVRAILMANELLADEINPAAPSGRASDLLASELRSVALQIPNPHDLLGRTDAFLRWSTTTEAKNSSNALDIQADFTSFTGLSPLDYYAGAYSALARITSMNNWDDVEKIGVAFESDRWMSELGNPSALRQWISVNKFPISEARSEWKAEPSLSAVGAGTLWRRPLVESDDGLLFMPSPVIVANAMGDGVYYALMDGYRERAGSNQRARKDAVERYTRLYGEFFEDYIVDLIRHAYSARRDAQVSGEVEYVTGVMSSDVVIREAGDILLVEVVAKRMGFRDSVLRLEPASIARDIQAGVIAKARQLDRNVKDFRNGVLFPDWPRTANQRIFPIIVAPNDWPRITIIDSVLPDVLRNEGLLSTAEPLELLDAGEVEWLGSALPSGLRFGELLDRKNKSAKHNRMMSLHNYLYYVEPGTSPDAVPTVRGRGGEIALRIIERVRSWRESS
jgi:hypothetical protein